MITLDGEEHNNAIKLAFKTMNEAEALLSGLVVARALSSAKKEVRAHSSDGQSSTRRIC